MTTADPGGPTARRHRARPAAFVIATLAALALVVPVACSDDDTGGDDEATTTTAPDQGEGEATPDVDPDDPDPEEGGADAPDPDGEEAEEAEEAAPPTTEPLPDDAERYEVTLDDQDGATVAFGAVDGVIPSFTVTGLVVDCFPLDDADEVPPRTVGLTMTDIEVDPDGFVDHGEPDQPWSPLLVGTFTADGEFAGNLEVNRRDATFVCGGEFTFTAPGA